jgi:hypothetical protein
VSLSSRPLEGFRLLAKLPDGYDARMELALAPNGYILVVHPDLPPLSVSPEGVVEEIDLSADPKIS